MCKEVEKVLEQKTETPVLCTVTMDGEERSSDDFVCVLSKENGDASLFYNTDTITLGMAMRMIARAIVDTMRQLSTEEREQVGEILDDILLLNKTQEEPTDE